MLTNAGLQLYAWRHKEMVTEDVGSFLHYNELQWGENATKNSKYLNLKL